MRQTVALHAFSLSKQLAFTATFAALCFVGTIVVAIPLPMGYFNIGDVFVLLAAWCLGPIYGSVAAGLGSALADIVAGFGFYAPFTFLIKALDAFIAYMAWFFLRKWIRSARLDFIPRILSAVLGESIMVLGYLCVETIFYGFAAATGTLFGNVLQGVCCLILASATLSLLYPIKGVSRLFPHLKTKE